MNPNGVFTGRARARKTSLGVKIADRIASWLITVGGIGAIVVVSTVFLFLLWVTLPLIFPPQILSTAKLPALIEDRDAGPLRIGVDENLVMVWSLFEDGALESYRLTDLAPLQRIDLFEGRNLSAAYFSSTSSVVAFGFEDGAIQYGDLRVAARFLREDTLPESVRLEADAGTPALYENGLVVKTPDGSYRMHELEVDMQPPVSIAEDSPIIHIAHTSRSGGAFCSVMTGNDDLMLVTISSRQNFMTGVTELITVKTPIPYQAPEGRGAPQFLNISGLGDYLYLAWRDGLMRRYNVRDAANPFLAETVHLLYGDEAELTALDFLIGKTTLIAGDSRGRLRAWFPMRPEDVETSDGVMMAAAHDLPAGEDRVTTLAASARTRMLAAGYADGSVHLYNVTNNYRMKTFESGEASIASLTLGARNDALFAYSAEGLRFWRFDPRHPEATFASLFFPVWYEGHSEPRHVWQSSSGTDAFEPKFGMMPLIFGTIKATLYSMLFGLPLALLAAIYTSEFLHPRARSLVKPLIEMMASLPSVVLGFLAALVFAPMIERVITATLVFFVVIPFTLLLCAYFWQLLPHKAAVAWTRYRLFFIFASLPLGLWLTDVLAGPLERWFFAGDIRAWLDGQIGDPTGGWMILLTPLSAVVTLFITSQWVNPWFRNVTRSWTRARFAAVDLIKFTLTCAFALGGAYLASLLLTSLGWDARGTYVDTYVQRNALIVGFMMGFAIIPIIYTIAEDALSSVPEHLRSASLGCGATQWQTAMRIIIPTAMSGLFSAIMIGLGRAVGETMIVLMAAGNTPVLEWNIFSGFRTLSANIAVELPEAVRNSTHYRTLFLAALVLFAMTFVVNTIAEIVRLRFRKRAYEL